MSRYNQMMQFFQLRSRGGWLVALAVMGAMLSACGEKSGDTDQEVLVDTVVPYAPAITSFSADPTQVAVGQSSTLAWSAHAETCVVEPEPGLLSATAGTAAVSPTSTTLYILTCTVTGADAVTATAAVAITPNAPDDEPIDEPILEPDPPPFAVHVSGYLTYDSVPPSATGLNYPGTIQKPIRAVRVQLVHKNSAAVITETVSGADGSYAVTGITSGLVLVRAYAETLVPHIGVEDNTQSDAQYVLDSSASQATTTMTLSLRARSGWTGSGYGAARSAAPFAILDAAYTAAEAFLDVRAPSFSRLHINWSENNRPSDTYDVATGEIYTSHWDGSELYILGKADVDTDEFDTHIIVHEWGHYFESTLGRSDSLGGSHSFGDVLDPAVAFGEGWGNALSGIVLYPDAIYADTYDPQQSAGFEINIDDNVGEDPVPGWFSEASVQSILYDLFDPDDEAWDTVSLGLGPLYDVMVGAQKSTPARTTIFSFIDGLKQAHADVTEAVDTLTSKHFMDPVSDAYGGGESHDGGFAGSLPVYKELTINGGAVGVDFEAASDPNQDYNKLTSVRNLRFTGNGSTVTLTSTALVDVDVSLLRDGQTIAEAFTNSGNETLADIATQNGVEYVVTVVGWHADTISPGPDAYSASIQVVSP